MTTASAIPLFRYTACLGLAFVMATACGHKKRGSGSQTPGIQAPVGGTTTGDVGVPPRIENGDVFGYEAAFREELEALGYISPQEFALKYQPSQSYLPKLSWDPTMASFYKDFEAKGLGLQGAEVQSFAKNGFVVSERLGGHSFASSYFRIFRNDLPVFITADSMLHAWHRSYDSILKELEEDYLAATLDEILAGMEGAILGAFADYSDGPLKTSVEDADYYLAVARALLSGHASKTMLGVRDAQVLSTMRAIKARKIHTFMLFGRERKVDFSQFKVRGHYADSEPLKRYFRAMMWLGRVPMRVAGSDSEEHTRQLGSAIVLHDLLDRSGQFPLWEKLNQTLRLFVGTTDSMNFEQLGALLEAGDIANPSQVTMADLVALENKINEGVLEAKKIHGDASDTLPLGVRSVSLPHFFSVMGQRFTLDGWALWKVLADKIAWNGKNVQRRLPSALDMVFAVLGNDNAVPLITERITDTEGKKFRDGLNYQHNLAAARNVIDKQQAASWSESIPGNWLATLSKLSKSTTAKKYPDAMRTKAWAMKDINTQVASWAQLRHDTVLYARPSDEPQPCCFYPAGFVDPRPAFWKRFEEMARTTAKMLEETPYPVKGEKTAVLKERQESHVAFFRNFASRLELLGNIADKQFNGKRLNKDERYMLKNIVQIEHGCAFSEYNGWYPELFYGGPEDSDSSTKIVTDIYTHLPSDQLNDGGGVLHQGIGDVDLLMVAIDNGKDRMVYAGPTMSHYEFETNASERMTDREWKEELYKGNKPPRPAWTADYLVPETR